MGKLNGELNKTLSHELDVGMIQGKHGKWSANFARWLDDELNAKLDRELDVWCERKAEHILLLIFPNEL